MAKIPAELRVKIYSCVRPAPINITDKRENWSRYPLSEVCYETRAEFRKYYFSNRVFMIDVRGNPDYHDKVDEALGKWRHWLHKLGNGDARWLNHLMFYGDKYVIRLEISRAPLNVTLSVKAKDGSALPMTSYHSGGATWANYVER